MPAVRAPTDSGSTSARADADSGPRADADRGPRANADRGPGANARANARADAAARHASANDARSAAVQSRPQVHPTPRVHGVLRRLLPVLRGWLPLEMRIGERHRESPIIGGWLRRLCTAVRGVLPVFERLRMRRGGSVSGASEPASACPAGIECADAPYADRPAHVSQRKRRGFVLQAKSAQMRPMSTGLRM